MQALCQLSYSPGKPADYSEGTRIAAKLGAAGKQEVTGPAVRCGG
jgi:hypothetical protein